MYISWTIFFKIGLTIILISASFALGSDNHYQLSPQPHSETHSKTSYSSEDIGLVDSIYAPKPGWIDPFEMLGESRSRDSLIVQTDVEIHVLQKRCNSYEVYLRRFVNLFLNAVNLRDTPDIAYSQNNEIKLKFLIDGKDIKTLKEFGQGEINAPKIELVDNIFSKIFVQKTPQEANNFNLSGFFMWLHKAFWKIISSPEWTILSSVLLLMFMTLWFIYHTHSYRMAVFTVLLTIFLAGFGFTWLRMYEEKEVERYVNIVMNGNIPRHCSRESQTMAWYEHMYFRMFGVDCQEFFKSRDIRPIVKVSPTDVLAETFSSMIINPATNVGKAYGNFISSIMGHVPWWLKPVALPLSLILPVMFVIILLAFLFNYRLSLSITGFHLIPTWSHSCQSGVRNGHQYVEECPRTETNISQQNSTNIPLLDSNAPLFVMNWKGLKKLSSSSLLGETNKNKEAKETVNEDDEEDETLKDDTKEMMENLKEFEKFVESVETQKAMEDRKKRSIHTCAEGENSLTNRRNDPQKALMIENSDLPSGDRNRISADTGKENDFKDKAA